MDFDNCTSRLVTLLVEDNFISCEIIFKSRSDICTLLTSVVTTFYPRKLCVYGFGLSGHSTLRSNFTTSGCVPPGKPSRGAVVGAARTRDADVAAEQRDSHAAAPGDSVTSACAALAQHTSAYSVCGRRAPAPTHLCRAVGGAARHGSAAAAGWPISVAACARAPAPGAALDA